MAGDEGDVLAGERQARPEQAADRAGADDGDLHVKTEARRAAGKRQVTAPMLPSPGLALRRAGPSPLARAHGLRESYRPSHLPIASISASS